ncbi:trigger factor, partial [Clostridioides difficile]|uniref:trigger factor n=1 Tax=Clostridioides difficile TaxID=1496 RepID=UPI0018DB1A58
PAAHVRKLYGKGLMQEIVQEAVSEGQSKALAGAKRRPAAEPGINLDQAVFNEVLEGRGDLAFDLSFELMPEFE